MWRRHALKLFKFNDFLELLIYLSKIETVRSLLVALLRTNKFVVELGDLFKICGIFLSFALDKWVKVREYSLYI
jgi:hypothetical protein